MSHTSIYVHLVFATKHHYRSICKANKTELYNYLVGVFRENNCRVNAINGTEDHIHILFELNPTVSLSFLVADVKRSSSKWLTSNPSFPDFSGWAGEYGAFSCSLAHKKAVIEYIRSQEEHHSKVDFETEYSRIAFRNGIEGTVIVPK